MVKSSGLQGTPAHLKLPTIFEVLPHQNISRVRSLGLLSHSIWLTLYFIPSLLKTFTLGNQTSLITMLWGLKTWKDFKVLPNVSLCLYSCPVPHLYISKLAFILCPVQDPSPMSLLRVSAEDISPVWYFTCSFIIWVIISSYFIWRPNPPLISLYLIHHYGCRMERIVWEKVKHPYCVLLLISRQISTPISSSLQMPSFLSWEY